MNAIVVAFPWRTCRSWVLWKIGHKPLQPAATAGRKSDHNIFSVFHIMKMLIQRQACKKIIFGCSDQARNQREQKCRYQEAFRIIYLIGQGMKMEEKGFIQVQQAQIKCFHSLVGTVFTKIYSTQFDANARPDLFLNLYPNIVPSLHFESLPEPYALGPLTNRNLKSKCGRHIKISDITSSSPVLRISLQYPLTVLETLVVSSVSENVHRWKRLKGMLKPNTRRTLKDFVFRSEHY